MRGCVVGFGCALDCTIFAGTRAWHHRMPDLTHGHEVSPAALHTTGMCFSVSGDMHFRREALHNRFWTRTSSRKTTYVHDRGRKTPLRQNSTATTSRALACITSAPNLLASKSHGSPKTLAFTSLKVLSVAAADLNAVLGIIGCCRRQLGAQRPKSLIACFMSASAAAKPSATFTKASLPMAPGLSGPTSLFSGLPSTGKSPTRVRNNICEQGEVVKAPPACVMYGTKNNW